MKNHRKVWIHFFVFTDCKELWSPLWMGGSEDSQTSNISCRDNIFCFHNPELNHITTSLKQMTSNLKITKCQYPGDKEPKIRLLGGTAGNVQFLWPRGKRLEYINLSAVQLQVILFLLFLSELCLWWTWSKSVHFTFYQILLRIVESRVSWNFDWQLVSPDKRL